VKQDYLRVSLENGRGRLDTNLGGQDLVRTKLKKKALLINYLTNIELSSLKTICINVGISVRDISVLYYWILTDLTPVS